MKIFKVLSLLPALLLALTLNATTDAKKTESALAPADDTVKNVRDRDSSTITPEDQVETATDRKIVLELRRTIVGDSTLSTNAKNIKIISIEGKVTLRGPVDSRAEKEKIAILAKGMEGVSKVDDKLEIAEKTKRAGD